MNDPLKLAAQEGDIDLLYTLIQMEPYILEHIDLVPFIDTPLHIAASFGNISFATEIMRLKPSFSWKLNQFGLSPIHLALQNKHYKTACRFVEINKELVRVKGREGITPLHVATQIGKIDLLAKFLEACPGSIEDVTVRSETALHIAVTYKQIEALEVLVGWLQRTCQRHAHGLEKRVLNWKDEDGYTVLHISVLKSFSQAVRLLIESNIDINSKNSDDLTALDIVETHQTLSNSTEIRDLLLTREALRGFSLPSTSLREQELRSKITFTEKITIYATRLRRRISNDTRNALLVVAILFATSTYEAALSPPGGVYQSESSKRTTSTSLKLGDEESIGKVVMNVDRFFWFWLLNTCSFYLSVLMICLLMPRGRISAIVTCPLSLFSGCYAFSMLVISPSLNLSVATVVMPCLFVVLYCWGTSVYVRLGKRLKNYGHKVEDRSLFSRGNRW